MESLTERYQAQPGTDEYEYLQRLDSPMPREVMDYLLDQGSAQDVGAATSRMVA